MDKTYKEEFLDKAINLTDTILNKFCVGKRIWRGGEYCYGYKCTKKEMKQFIKEQEPTWDKETIERLTNLNITKDNVLMVDEHNHSWGMQDEITDILMEQEYNE